MKIKPRPLLADLGITDATPFEDCDDIGEEFKVLRKTYLKKALADHPDKGGDPVVFHATQAAWEVLRDLYDENKILGGSFTSYFDGTTAAEGEEEDDELDELYKKYASNTNVPSSDYFEAAAEEEVPGYKGELAKSGRSECQKCQGKIPKGDVRVGSLDKVAGSYGRWHHLDCWRVPVKVQNGLTDPSNDEASLRDLISMEEVLLTGVAALSDENKSLFVQHCVNSEHWARGRKRKAKPLEIMDDAGSAKKGKTQTTVGGASAGGGPGNIVPGSFVVLVPGVDGALSEDALKGKTFVISGCFPEAGGGEGDAIGVEIVKAMIDSFGGRVVSRFSKKTNYLLVGQDAVASKLKDATKREVVVISLRRLQGLLLGHCTLAKLATYPALTADLFVGNEYSSQAAGPPPPGGSANASAKPPATKKPAAKAKAPPKSEVPKAPPAAAAKAASASTAMVAVAGSSNEATSTAVVNHTGKKVKFQIPRPGVNGAIAADALEGKRFVLTGTFPELGGGTGLTLGKDRTTAMIESFGGRVTSAVSGKTDILLVGAEPGASKVGKANTRGIPLITLLSLQKLLTGRASLEDMASEPPPRITNFSAGYPGQKRIGY